MDDIGIIGVGYLRSQEGLTEPPPRAETRPGVDLYESGCILRRGGIVPNITAKGGGKRGKVLRWSAASRRRLRRALLELTAPEGWATLGLTFTIPGPVMPPEQAAELWHTFCRSLNRHRAGLIWRAEVQERGQLHWHGIGIGRDSGRNLPSDPGWWSFKWAAAVESLGPVHYPAPYFGPDGTWDKGIVSASSRMALPGAMAHAFEGQSSGTARGAWLRYLQDHASKSKQGQVGASIGRHWGIVGRRHWARFGPLLQVDLTDREYNCVRRAYERLATPSFKAAGVPFGRRLGFRCRRGRSGSAVCFCRPDTMARLVSWARKGGVA